MRRLLFITALSCAIVLPQLASAQAWLPGKGRGLFSTQYSYYQGGDHLFSSDALDGESSRGYVVEGNRWYIGDTFSHTFQFYTDYGIFDRLALSASIAWVRSRYEGLAPVNRDIDDGKYHNTWQDVGFDLRGVLFQRPVLITPFIGYGFPTQQYANFGHAAAGRRLNEVRLGTHVGWRADALVPRMYLHGSFTYGVAEEVQGVQVKRSLFDGEIGYFISRRVGVRAIGMYQNSSGGLDWLGDPDNPSTDHVGGPLGFETALADARFARLGAGVMVPIPWSLTVYSNMFWTVWGENIEEVTIVSLGVLWNFRTSFARPDGWGEDW